MLLLWCQSGLWWMPSDALPSDLNSWLNVATTDGSPQLAWLGQNQTEPRWQGSALHCSALGSPSAPGSPALREQLALAAPWQRALINAIWFLLFCLSLPRNAADLPKGSFCTVPFGFSLHVSCYCVKQSSNYLFYVSPYPFFSGGIHEWKRKNISLSLCHVRGKAAYTLFHDCALVQELDKIRFYF